MNKLYDYEWITRNINNSFVFSLVDAYKNAVAVYQASDIINIVGDNVEIKNANINDLTNLITIGVMRFTTHDGTKYIDIPIRNLYRLFKKTNILTPEKIEFINEPIPLTELEAFVPNKEIDIQNYSFVVARIDTENEMLKRLLNLIGNYNNMGMSEKFEALNEINNINYQIEA